MKDLDITNIIIADDNSEFIEGLRLILSKDSKYQILDTCSNGLELTKNENLAKADLLLIDIEMPEMNGIDAAIAVNYDYPKLPMIALTMHQEKVYLNEIICAGFKGFIYKPDVPKQLAEVIHLVKNDKFCFPDNLKERINSAFNSIKGNTR